MSYVPNNFQEDIAYNKRESLVLNRMSSSILRWFQKSLFWDEVTKRLITHKRLPPMQCYHIVSDCRDVYPAKNYDENYSPRMVPVAKNYRVWPMAYLLTHLIFIKKIKNSLLKCFNFLFHTFGSL